MVQPADGEEASAAVSEAKLMATYYAIRHIPSGHFMPGGRRGRGFTHDNPASLEACPPRLFLDRISAQKALTWWLKGESCENRSSDWQTGEIDVWVELVPREDRIPEHMEIVALTITEAVSVTALLVS
jgi:hypothetical protein